MILLRNATYVDIDTQNISVKNILVEKGKPLSFPENTVNIDVRENAESIDCSGKIVFRSFVNGHHHAYSALSRGMPAPSKTPADFKETLQYVWWKLDKALDPEMIKISAYITAIAAAKAGCTFIIDHHSSPSAIKGSLGAIASAFEEVGIGHLLCYEISDRDGVSATEEGLIETDEYLSGHQGLVGLHASFTLSENTLNKAIYLTDKHATGIHIHVAEDKYDQDFTMKNYGCRVVERLENHGLLESSKTILAHCIHLDDNERRIIRVKGVTVVQNCESNLNNKVGYFNADNTWNRIMYGTDGMHSDMLRSAQYSYFTGLNNENMSPDVATGRLNYAHCYLKDNGFGGDGDDNLIVLDYDSPTPVNSDNFKGHMIYGMNSAHIRHVISQGRLIIQDGRVITVDEENILREARSLAQKLWKKII